MTHRWALFLYLALYLATLTTVCVLVSRARQQALANMSTSQAQTDWEEWRTVAARQQQGDGPIHRRAPRSQEPPTLVLLRDHYWTSLGGILLLTSALFVTALFLLRGLWIGPSFPIGSEEASTESDAV